MSEKMRITGIFIPLPIEFLEVTRNLFLAQGLEQAEVDSAIFGLGCQLGKMAAELAGEQTASMEILRNNIESLLNQTAVGRVEDIKLLSGEKRQLVVTLGDTAESIANRAIGCERGCQFTAGYLTGTMVHLIGFECTGVETQCVTLGGDACLFVLQPLDTESDEGDCPNCGAGVDPDSIRCRNCLTIIRCHQCKEEIQSRWRTCPYCGVELVAARRGGVRSGVRKDAKDEAERQWPSQPDPPPPPPAWP